VTVGLALPAELPAVCKQQRLRVCIFLFFSGGKEDDRYATWLIVLKEGPCNTKQGWRVGKGQQTRAFERRRPSACVVTSCGCCCLHRVIINGIEVVDVLPCRGIESP